MLATKLKVIMAELLLSYLRNERGYVLVGQKHDKRVGVGVTLHSVRVTLFCSTCAGTVKKLGPFKTMSKVK